jgi:RNA polymerase sigma factor (TIGR02999 family)
MNLDQQIAQHYEELKRLAHRMLLRGNATLQTTALVHELFLKLRSHAAADSEAHLMNLAARAMRQVLVDAARRRASEKRGGDQIAVTITNRFGAEDRGLEVDVLALEQSLHALEQSAPELAQVVELHFFGGLSFPEIGRLLGVTERTVFRYWRTARAQIQLDMTGGAE